MTDVIEFSEIKNAEEIEKKWKFRKLCAKDLFPLANLISKIGVNEFVDILSKKDVTDAIKKAVEAGETEQELSHVGFTVVVQAVQVILANLDKCEDDIYRILSSTSNLGVKDIQNLSMGEFMEMIVDFIKKDDFADFFKQVSSLLG